MAKKGLGKGLSSLIGEGSSEQKKDQAESMIALAKIKRNENQPRKHFDKSELEELSESIKANGVLQPILLRRAGSLYEIVAGERRYQAAQLAGLKEIPAIIRDIQDNEMLQLALIENLQRADLNPVEEALGYKSLIDEKALTQEQLAQLMSKSRPAIANSLRLLDLPDEILSWLAEAKITAGHARALLVVPSEEGRVRLAQKIISDGLSVRQTEQLAPLFFGGEDERPRRIPSPKSYRRVARQLRNKLKTSVSVKQVRGKNKIEITFADEDDLSRIVAAILGA